LPAARPSNAPADRRLRSFRQPGAKRMPQGFATIPPHALQRRDILMQTCMPLRPQQGCWELRQMIVLCSDADGGPPTPVPKKMMRFTSLKGVACNVGGRAMLLGDMATEWGTRLSEANLHSHVKMALRVLKCL